MRKNKAMRLASVLLVMVLLTTSVVSGTFAKYTTEKSGSDTARVAKWGIDLTGVTTFDLFDVNGFDAATKVAAADGLANVVAPGTTHDVTVTLAAAGSAPEVAYTLALAIDTSSDAVMSTFDGLAGFNWTLKLPGASTATKYATWDAFKAAVNAYSKDYNANQLPDSANSSVTLGWEWVYEDADDSDANDGDDTAAGNATTLASTGTITLTVSATQIN